MTKEKPKRLRVYAFQDGEGYTYSFSLDSEDFLKAKYPNAAISDRLFLAQDITRDFATVHQTIAAQVLALLTQLPPEEIATLGPWEFRESDEDALLFTWPNTPSVGKTNPTPGKAQRIAPSTKSPRSSHRKAAG